MVSNTIPKPTKTSLGALDLKCPPLPQTLLQAVDLMHRQDGPTMEEVIKMVQHDPGVVARLLRVVNSAYYGQRGEITSVRRAIIIMGTVPVTGIVMSMSLQDVRSAFDSKAILAFINLVRHSIATAYLAQQILIHDPKQSLGDPMYHERLGEIFTAALLHDFGKLVFLYNYPEIAAPFYGEVHPGPRTSQERLEEEKLLFKYSHVEAGVYLSQKLHFPDALTKSIGLHHRVEALRTSEKDVQEIALAIAAANKAVNALEYGFNDALSWETCIEAPVWDLIVEEHVYGYADKETIFEMILSVREEMSSYVDAII